MKDRRKDALDYPAALNEFDAALCEAIAVSQGTSGRLPLPHVSYGTYVFTRLCAHGTGIVRSVPGSRWVSSDHAYWDFSMVAGHARALLEGRLSFAYLMEEPGSEAEWKARVNVMHLYDCTRRATLMEKLGAEPERLAKFVAQQEELKGRLTGNEYFMGLPASVQRDCLKGEKPWIKSREQLLAMVGMDKADFGALWILYSQYSHILPLSFYRMEPEGRGTGIEHDADTSYMTTALLLGADVLRGATDAMVLQFPDVSALRRGIASKFSPGPKENLPAERDATSLDEEEMNLPKSALSTLISGFVRVARRVEE